jgi:hypothetical protein
MRPIGNHLNLLVVQETGLDDIVGGTHTGAERPYGLPAQCRRP